MMRYVSALSTPLLFFAIFIVQQAAAETTEASDTATTSSDITILEHAIAAAAGAEGMAAKADSPERIPPPDPETGSQPPKTNSGGQVPPPAATKTAASEEAAAPQNSNVIAAGQSEKGVAQDTTTVQLDNSAPSQPKTTAADTPEHAEGAATSQPDAASGATAASKQIGEEGSDKDQSASAQTQAQTQGVIPTQDTDTPNTEQTTRDILPPATPTGLRAADQTERMVAAAQQVLEQTSPVALGKAGRVIVTYGEALPVLVCTSLAVCAVELEKGENLVDTPVLGDPVRWIMEQRQVNWPGQQKQWIFVFKPTADADRMSTAVFVTDRRIYSIVLKRHPYEYIPILSFDYPDTRHRLIAEKIEADRAAKLKAEADELKRKADAEAAAAARANRAVKTSGTQTVRGLVPAEKLDFDYRITGRAPFKPAQVYNDGRKTYVVLPASYRGSTPVLLAGSGASNKAINISFKDGRYVVDRLVSSFTLQDGSKTVTIKRIGS